MPICGVKACSATSVSSKDSRETYWWPSFGAGRAGDGWRRAMAALGDGARQKHFSLRLLGWQSTGGCGDLYRGRGNRNQLALEINFQVLNRFRSRDRHADFLESSSIPGDGSF